MRGDEMISRGNLDYYIYSLYIFFDYSIHIITASLPACVMYGRSENNLNHFVFILEV